MMETTENKGVMYEFGSFVLDPKERVLFADGKPIPLTKKVFETLLLLIKNNGRLLTKSEMIESIWEGSFVEEGNLTKNISRLRKILNVGDLQLIETRPRQGYRFLAEVKEIKGDANLSPNRSTHLDRKSKKSSSTWLMVAFALLAFIGGLLIYGFLTSPETQKSGSLINLTNDRGEDLMPSWSPDGSRIVFTSNRNGTADVYVMNADGTGVTRLTRSSGTEVAPVWSPDGSKIFMDSDRDGNREIYSMNSDGSNQTRLTFNPTSDCGPVSMSPDGKRIAFARNASNEGPTADNFDIYTMNIDGSDVRQLTTDPKFDAEPIWSPDGNRILFISGRDRNFEIYTINKDGSGERNSTNSVAYEGAFAFTVSGAQVLFLGNSIEKAESNQVYLLNADGTNRRQITSFSEKIDRVSYSAAAGKFAVSSRKEGNFEIYVMDAGSMPAN